MQIHLNPANARFPGDFANYQKEFMAKPETKKEIKEILHKKKAKYPDWDPKNPTKDDDLFLTLEAFQDFAYDGDTPVDRLGGSLGDRPHRLDHVEDAIPPRKFSFDRSHDVPPPTPPQGTVTIDDDGAILHSPEREPDPINREAADHYMHHVFDDILYESRDLLEDINTCLSNYTSAPTKVNRDLYAAAVMNFEDFCASLKTRTGNTYAQAFNWVTIDPVVTNEGYIVSARIEVNWKNPYHSSSTIRVP